MASSLGCSILILILLLLSRYIILHHPHPALIHVMQLLQPLYLLRQPTDINVLGFSCLIGTPDHFLEDLDLLPLLLHFAFHVSQCRLGHLAQLHFSLREFFSHVIGTGGHPTQ